MASQSTNTMIFRQMGGAYHLWVDGDTALLRLHELDPARWAVTSLPVADLQADPKLVEFLDPDQTGRLRVDQMVAARDWLLKHLKGRERLPLALDAVRLADIDTSTPGGEALRRTAERVLTEQKTTGREAVTLAHLRAYQASYASALTNGDGVVPPPLLPEPDLAAFAEDVMKTVGSTPDLSGKPGVGRPELKSFLKQGTAWLEWNERGRNDATLFPLGSATPTSAALVEELEEKLQQYFLQCDLLREEPELAARFKLDAEAAAAFPVADSKAIEERLKVAALAPPRPDGILAADAPINPHYAPMVARLRNEVLTPLLGADQTTLARADWEKVKAALAPYRTWQASKITSPFGALGEEKVRAYFAGDLPARLEAMIDADLAAAPEIAALSNLERLLLFHRYLVVLANSMVGLGSLTDAEHRPLFNMGTLVIDGRRLDFTVRVSDREAHKKVATESRIFLVYAKITDKEGGASTLEVAAPVTRGERGRLNVGKRGLFIGRDGVIRDAQVVDVLAHPISIPEAIRAPFRKGRELVTKKLGDLLAAKAPDLQAKVQGKVQEKLTAAVAPAIPGMAPAVGPPSPAAPPPPPPAKKGFDASSLPLLLVGGSAAFAALLSALTYLFSQLAKIAIFDLVGVLGTILAVIVAVSAIVGWFKLRSRDLSPVLEANGWAMNSQLLVNGRMAKLFNRTPPLPEGHKKVRPLLGAMLPDDSETRGISLSRIVTMLLCFLGIATLVFYYVWWPELNPELLPDPNTPKAAPTPTPTPSPAPTADPLAVLNVPGLPALGAPASTPTP